MKKFIMRLLGFKTNKYTFSVTLGFAAQVEELTKERASAELMKRMEDFVEWSQYKEVSIEIKPYNNY